jgi:hypothetical protein
VSLGTLPRLITVSTMSACPDDATKVTLFAMHFSMSRAESWTAPTLSTKPASSPFLRATTRPRISARLPEPLKEDPMETLLRK